MNDSQYQILTTRAEQLVKERIIGHRKGLPDMPNFIHSFRVAELLKKYRSNETVQLAGLLHDIVEDGGMTFEELVGLGFPEEVLDLVRLCTHDMSVSQKDLRWILMLIKLVRADSTNAWVIKLADVFDNIQDAHALSEEREKFMREVKIPVLLSASEHLLGTSEIWRGLKGEI